MCQTPHIENSYCHAWHKTTTLWHTAWVLHGCLLAFTTKRSGSLTCPDTKWHAPACHPHQSTQEDNDEARLGPSQAPGMSHFHYLGKCDSCIPGPHQYYRAAQTHHGHWDWLQTNLTDPELTNHDITPLDTWLGGIRWNPTKHLEEWNQRKWNRQDTRQAKISHNENTINDLGLGATRTKNESTHYIF